MNNKLIEILLEKIEELEEKLKQKETYIYSLEVESVNLKQIIDDLRKKENQNDNNNPNK